MTPDKRTDRLRALMAKYKLKAKDVGAILERSPQTVRSWSCAYVHRAIPEHALFKLEAELKRREEGAE